MFFQHDNDEGSDRNTSNEIENACPNPSDNSPNETIAEIGIVFEGAPQMVNINILILQWIRLHWMDQINAFI